AVVGAVTAVSWVGIRSTATASTALTGWKVAVLGGFVLTGLWSTAAWPALPHDPVPALDDLGGALLAMMFAFAGFEAAAISAAEARDPARDLPFALLGGLLLVAVIYGAVQHVCGSALPDLAAAERPVVQAVEASFGSGAAQAFAMAAAVMLLGSLLSQLLGTSRLVYALAEHGELPRWLARVDPHTRAPTRAIAVTAAAAAAATLASSFLTAVSVTVVTRVATWFVICAALPVLRRAGPAPFALPGGPAIAVASGLATLGLLSASAPREWAIAAVLVAAGLAARWWLRGSGLA
ncbi:MAG: amino acid permease, partial [Myxococcota bacterium]